MTDAAFDALEALRERFIDWDMWTEAETLNEAHYLLQEYGDEIDTDDPPREVWAETKVSAEGVSVSLYRERDDGHAVLLDEDWATWDELRPHTADSGTYMVVTPPGFDGGGEQ